MSFFKVDDSFLYTLPADSILENKTRLVENACYSFVTPRQPSSPSLLAYSSELAHLIGLEKDFCENPFFVALFSGKKVYPNTTPYAMAYGGHQFGHWAGQLGDGRAINLFEITHNQQRWAVQLKGAGPTPYARNADGLAVLRSSIREFLCSEAMYHLGVPSTRALSLIRTGDEVLRDMLYDGHPTMEQGAVVCRLAPTFIRFGNFELFASRKDTVVLKKMADYVIQYFFPTVNQSNDKKRYDAFFAEVCRRSLEMLIHWLRVGFVHGVMNTDNMSILGLTIDYGPYGWLDMYDPHWTPNITDKQYKKYRFGNQANIILWNLIQLANALYPLVEDTKSFTSALEQFKHDYVTDYHRMMCLKLGCTVDRAFVKKLENLLERTQVDMTIFFRKLALYEKEMDTNALSLTEILAPVKEAFYDDIRNEDTNIQRWVHWIKEYVLCLRREKETDSQRREKMNGVNPKYVLRNYMAQLAIDAANQSDYTVLHEFQDLLKRPYDEREQYHHKWFVKRPDWAKDKVGCSMLSCSS